MARLPNSVVAPPVRDLRVASGEIFERHHQALNRYSHSITGNGHDAADAMLRSARAAGDSRRSRCVAGSIALRATIDPADPRSCPEADLGAAPDRGDRASERLVESCEHLRSPAATSGSETRS